MSDPIWRKVAELTKQHGPHFNAAAAYDVVKTAWRMGFDVIEQPPGSDLYNAAMQEIGISMQNRPLAAMDAAGMANAAQWLTPTSAAEPK